MWWEILLGAVLGTIFSIGLTALFEMIKKPKLVFEIYTHPAAHYETGTRPAEHAQFLYVKLKNENLSKFWSIFVSRNTTSGCKGRISFHRIDGTPLYNRLMTLRWTGADEPQKFQVLQLSKDRKTLEMGIDFDRFNYVTEKKDIGPGEYELFNIAVRLDKDEKCYGWCNESYSSEPLWRNPRWEIPKGVFLVYVEILTSTVKINKIFRLENDLSLKDFKLSPAMPTDKIIRVSNELG